MTFDVKPDLAMPDAWLATSFCWRAIEPPTSRPDAYAYAQLVNEEGEQLDGIEFWTAKSTTPAVWAPGETHVSHQAQYQTTGLR